MAVPSIKVAQKVLYLCLAYVLWTVSGLITVTLFLELAGNSLPHQILAVVWAACLETTKVVAWRRGEGYRWVSVGLVVLTMFSALGVAGSTVELAATSRQQAEVQESTTYQNGKRRIEDLAKTISVLNSRLDALPPDYTTASANLTKALEVTQSRMDVATRELAMAYAPSESEGTKDSIGVVAHFFGMARSALEIVVILFVAVMTEASAIAIAGMTPTGMPGSTSARNRVELSRGPDLSRPEDQTGPVHRSDPTPDEYLKAALAHPNAPRLLGREKVAERLGITELQARKLLADLVLSGRIRRGTKSFQAENHADAPPGKV